MSEVSTDKKLKGKDLITIGIFSAIYFVINFAFMLLGGIHPVLWMLMPGFIAVFAGIPFMLMVAKVQKLGAVFLMGLITALIYFVTGQFTLVILISMASTCILAEVVRVVTKYNSFKGNSIAYVIFSLGMVGSPLPIWLFKADFLAQITEQGMPADYVAAVEALSSNTKYCSDRTPYVIPGEPAIEHIFSELYNVPVKIKKDYFKIKVLELLLYLDALELSGHTEERPYFYKGQVEKIKAIQALLTQDLTKNYTLEELSARFDIALTPMKNCFKSVYGSPIFTYMRNYRMNYAASLLKSDKSLKVAEIAGLVGYDSPSKFASAFHQTMGKTPLEYRKSII